MASIKATDSTCQCSSSAILVTAEIFEMVTNVKTAVVDTSRLSCSTSDGELDCGSPQSAGVSENERPERMRDWMIRCVQVWLVQELL